MTEMYGRGGRCMRVLYPVREVRPIMGLRRRGILSRMIGVPWLPSNFRVFSVGVLLAVCFAAAARADQIAAADRVVVRKSEHKLYLYSGDHLLGSYQVKLGLSPVGQKEREHDFRTPGGHYRLGRRR